MNRNVKVLFDLKIVRALSDGVIVKDNEGNEFKAKANPHILHASGDSVDVLFDLDDSEALPLARTNKLDAEMPKY